MLVFSDTRYIPTDLNTMVLQDDIDNYIYIHRLLYDSAVILADKYNNDYKKLAVDISPTGDMPEDREDVVLFYEHAPSPVNMLAPFLLLCNGKFDSYFDMAGAIHVMSNTFNFRKLPEIPKEVRLNAMQFSMSIKDEYKLSWELFISKCIPYSDDLLLNRNVTAATTVVTETSSSHSSSSEDEGGTFLTMPDGSKVDFNIDLSVFDNLTGPEDEQEEETVATPAPAPAPVEAPVESSKPSGMDFLKSLA